MALGSPVPAAVAVEKQVAYVWPAAVWSTPLLASGSSGAVPARLAELAERGFERYLDEVLPRELEADAAFAEAYRAADGSRANLGFLRWQKRVFASVTHVPVEELDWDGKPVPRVPGISYQWSELYGSHEFEMLKRRVNTMVSSFLNSLTGEKRKHKFRTFAWAEVYRPGDFQRPHTHTGAAVAGMFFARYGTGSIGGQDLVFEDMRGINPPFGRKHEHHPAQGELVLWPSWASHFLSPHPGNSTNVFFSFLIWPPNGAPDFDWEDDVTGDYVYRKTSSIKQKKPVEQAAPSPTRSQREDL